MKATHLFFALLCPLLSLEASALSLPLKGRTAPGFEDSTAKWISVAPSRPELRKRPTFFERLERKLLGVFAGNAATAPGKASTKSLLGWIALGATGLGVILLFAGTGPAGAVLLFGGLLMGIVALCLPRSKEDRAAGKKSNTGAIIAVVLGAGLIIAVAIALGNWKK